MLDNIFSIKEYNTTHNLLRLFGLKIKFPKKDFSKKQKENPYFYYIKNNVDITTIPPAEGQIRDIQLANLALLVELDYVCKQAGLKYWLDAGTLIGAIRHKGFIPWDDDIDTAMLREDFEQIIDAFAKFSRNPDIYADYTQDRHFNHMIKIQHKKCPFLFVDIFPWDTYGEKLTTETQIEISKKIKDKREKLKEIFSEQTSKQELIETYHNAMKEFIKENSNETNSDFVWGMEYAHRWNNWFTAKDVLLPLKTIYFEGYEFPCMNKPDDFLKRVYGDYMGYPKKIGFGHNAYISLSDDDKSNIEQLKLSIKR